MDATKARVAVIGAGMIGRAWALVFAQAGFRVSMWDSDPAAVGAALEFVRSQLADLDSFALLAEPADRILGRITSSTKLAGALDAADHVQENGPERLDLRRALFAELDALAPSAATLASSTSGMPASTFTETLPGRDRCLVAHPGNPPYLLPLVELCPAPWTSGDALERTRQFMVQAGRQVAVLQRETTGFLLNRLQGALLAEAFRLVADGVANPDDIDTVLKHGLGLRWSFMGPFETVDLNAPGGIADFCGRYGGLYEALQHEMTPRTWDAALVSQVAASRRNALALDGIPGRQAWRDRRLMALAAHQAQQPEK